MRRTLTPFFSKLVALLKSAKVWRNACTSRSGTMRMRRTLAFALLYVAKAIITTNKTKQNKKKKKETLFILRDFYTSFQFGLVGWLCFGQLSNLCEWLSIILPHRYTNTLTAKTRDQNICNPVPAPPISNKASGTNTLRSTQWMQPHMGYALQRQVQGIVKHYTN